MPIKPLTAAALVFVLLASSPLQAKSLPASPATGSTPAVTFDSPLPVQLPILDPATALARSVLPDAASLQAPAQPLTDAAADEQGAATAAASANITDLRKALIAMAMKLRDTRYVRGGRDPSSGFDCSGFVRYVFAHAVGMQLPRNSASQFLAGLKINRADMQPGDLVFFRTHGKRHISHVGIYISNGRFIHSPSAGKSVEISSLNEGYWAKRFAGAKRPEAMAQVAGKG